MLIVFALTKLMRTEKLGNPSGGDGDLEALEATKGVFLVVIIPRYVRLGVLN